MQPAPLSDNTQDHRPLYRRVADLVLREIMSGRLVDGARLPPERDMAADMGVAVGTLRKALEALSEDGLLERVQGSGNYVKAPAELSGVYAFFRLELLSGGGVPDATVLSLDKVPQRGDLPALATAGPAFRIRRLRRLDGITVAAEEIWLDGSAATDLSAGDLGPSLYRFYREVLGLWIARAQDRVGMDVWPDWAPLGTTSAPCGFVERCGQAADGRQVEVSRTWFDASVAAYVNKME
ncbi:MAG: GntR family transcriptional regulator [Oceanicola sp.]|nr:GntR family transcriptional regulator [Oceanicola sp.]